MSRPERTSTCQPDVADLFDHKLARMHDLFPLGCEGCVLHLAVAEPMHWEIVEKIEFATGRAVRESIYPLDLIRRSIDELYGAWTDSAEATFYAPGLMSGSLDDGTLHIKTSGYDRFGNHWTGWIEVSPDDPDFALWAWILANADLLPAVIEEKALEAIRDGRRPT